MTATASRFLRRTTLHEDEYRTNFRQIDCEIIATLTSDEAGRITSQMSKVYLCLVNAPTQYWEREGVLRFAGSENDGQCTTAWEQLLSLTGVASATARKALRWMNEQAIIGYYAGRNGVGIRIFINRAASSIGHRAQSSQKNLRLVQASNHAPHTSRNDMPFNDSFAVLDNLDSNINSGGPKNGADTEQVDQTSPESETVYASTSDPSGMARGEENSVGSRAGALSVEDVVRRVRCEIEPALKVAAVQAASREHERTREWLEKRGLPKAARVAQREAYDVLKRYGVIKAPSQRVFVESEADKRVHVPPAKPLRPEEIKELADACVSMLEVHGQAIDVTLAGMSAGAGGLLLAEDAPKVRQLALSMTLLENCQTESDAARMTTDEANHQS